MPTNLLIDIATQTFSGLLTNLVTSYFTKSRSRALGGSAATLHADLRPHFEVTFERCIAVKTIINDAPVETLKVYVDQTFICNRVSVDQFALIDLIRNGNSVVITGTGGGGKSMFMRYLWLSFFERSDGKIPIFFELRQTNSLTHSKFEDYLYHSILQTKSRITPSQFDSSLHHGEFILFLDGFDEVNVDRRADIEKHILELKENNPRLTIVVTSRPEDRFVGWQQFQTHSVNPLTKSQSIDLISKAQYEQTSKTRLLKRIASGKLYEPHGSFLSNPLLAYMMLLTVARNPDIPNRMHLFYEQAFDALFHRHDTSKGGYVRKFHSSDKQLFLRYLSYFSLITYHDQIVEFDPATLRHYVEKAVDIEKTSFNVNGFIEDVIESVCLLKRDGLLINFIHRSFQEYFAALCICRIASRNLEELFAIFAERHDDEVLRMVYEINPDLFREKYIVPFSKKYSKYFSSGLKRKVVQRYMGHLNAHFFANARSELRKSREKLQDGDRTIHVGLSASGDFYSFQQSTYRLGHKWRPNGQEDGSREEGGRRDQQFFLWAANEFNVPVDGLRVKSDGNELFLESEGREIRSILLLREFKKTYMYQYMTGNAKLMHSFVHEEVAKYNQVTSSFAAFFGAGDEAF